MPDHDAALLLGDMSAAAERVHRYVAGMGRPSCVVDGTTVDVVDRNPGIFGEAARRLPNSYTAQHPSVPWRQMAGLRHRIVHDYAGLDVEIVWVIVSRDVPLVAAALAGLMRV